MPAPVRSLVLWFPDWPVTALSLSSPTPLDPAEPVAVVRANTVVDCSTAARAEGVRRGQRRRDAQGACPRLRIVPDDPGRDERAFLAPVRHIEEISPGVQVLRPGLCALRARGPARYYGGEDTAARVILDALAGIGLSGVRAGVADGPFTAEQACRVHADSDIRIVPAGESATFLAPLPIIALEDAALADMLSRLGVHTLGEFAALELTRVRDRLSERGVRLHALASGADSRPVTPRVPPPELAREIAFEPPVELADQVAFAIRQTCDDVISGLAAVSLVCTEARIELHDDRGGMADRLWLHPTCFDAAALVDRVRWQLQSVWEDTAPVLSGGITAVRIIPETVDASAHHQPGLFGQGTDARLHHALSRVQGMLGHRAVLVPAIGGGRRLGDRQTLVPWGDRTVLAREPHRPWPGHLPAPLPSTVFDHPVSVSVLDVDGTAVTVDERDAISAEPVLLLTASAERRISSWAGPWPLHERSWDAAQATHAHRFQVVADDETAWLLLLDESGWHAEGRYD
ncbi:DNA polymerase Y family protein [Microbacterium gorillae]|uniref:DNA polymerase Y family protein n=1 Tax=Microbacterium gorillae TaxID=1231063 RepID=UPI00059084DA|nr:DNA polymerase Y family protein [Microbacterium gorillae]